MKAVLISIQPKWVGKIAIGKKTVEVRKSRPKLQTPFKCYIYATKGKQVEHCDGYTITHYGLGKVIGEFVCDRIDEYRAEFTDLEHYDARHKKVCQNTIKRVEECEEDDGVIYRYETSNEEENPDNCNFLRESCLTFNEVRRYIGATFFDKPFYAWHISQLKIYDKPKSLRDFRKLCPYTDGAYCLQNKCEYYFDYIGRCTYRIEKAPRSYCYVREE